MQPRYRATLTLILILLQKFSKIVLFVCILLKASETATFFLVTIEPKNFSVWYFTVVKNFDYKIC